MNRKNPFFLCNLVSWGINADDQARQILNKNDPNPMARRVVSHGKWTGIWQPTFHVASAGEESEKNANVQVVKEIRMSVVEMFPGFSPGDSVRDLFIPKRWRSPTTISKGHKSPSQKSNHLTKGHQQNCHEGVYDVFMAPTNLHLFHTDEK